RSLVARFVRDEEAVGSNPATPTPSLLRAAAVTGGHCRSATRPRFGPDRLRDWAKRQMIAGWKLLSRAATAAWARRPPLH
ncbi:MAG: hypothetical protein QOK09_3748, partial [Mycobacterium sp.]|nr:hypothetical protein [Mycobacterium sp.]